MTTPALDLRATRDALVAALGTLVSSRDYLNDLDKALGDGDHGSTIARGSQAAIKSLGEREGATVNEMFEVIGSAMMTSMGGASGILFGVLFRAAKNCPPAQSMDATVLARLLRQGLDDLKRKSPAVPGDKTMVDALVPAVEALEAEQTQALAEALSAAADAARRGADSTVGMLARFGRATTLGERAREARDPGATSVALFLEALHEQVSATK